MNTNEIQPKCEHRGPEAALVDCKTCQGSVHAKVFQCKMYGLCTINRVSKYMHCTAPCPDRKEPQA